MARIGRSAAGAATTVAALAIVATFTLLVALPRVTGGAALTVLTGSMSPTIPQGSVVLVRPVEDPLRLNSGDVITFQAAPGVEELVTHRVVRFQPDTTPPSFITKGDANRGEDIDPVPVGAVRGEVWFHVPHFGNVSEFVRGPRGWGLLAAFGGVMVLTHLIGMLRPRRTSSVTTAEST